ncbi:TDP-N-acetylfucosamine:lipid II N-acetylfucosaminyltransferase [Vibrio sp. EA2]|uniref:TDP-N-acetylfucosamine:lipid II N-acetylfucosaminyltransferase n=1 Tax=Vibrio sp. EA2 TaxID=3079860 RepID=UPI002949C2A8|nr:TDP-N-acetylfucosamine:lipid II N-acetylfucosaminyltransferase [Vibrio sp. EA2]MDV6253318.1 TDP-N-acetylfucosamine:lipid II N-acetylfucosaminyltransferase [Vibrio sp. EA2]
MKFVNIMNDDKFTADYLDFVEENLNFDEHVFFIFRSHHKFPIKTHPNVYSYSKKENNFFDYLVFLKKLVQHGSKSKKIILHGLVKFKVVQLLWVFRFLLPKCHWAIWGGDLYRREENLLTRKGRYREFFRKKVIKDMGYIITSIKGDYENAVKWYGTKAPYLSYFMYPASLYHDVDVPEKKDDKITILVGNSADPSNNHEEVFNIIKPYINDKVRVICPLNYGGKKHADKITKLGSKLFGTSFEPILDYMKYDDYISLLSTVDIAIFNHNRQQAMSNIRVLLGMGKKVYMRKEISSYRTLTDLGIKVTDVKDFSLGLSEEESANNINIVKSYYSKETLVSNLKNIFS